MMPVYAPMMAACSRVRRLTVQCTQCSPDCLYRVCDGLVIGFSRHEELAPVTDALRVSCSLHHGQQTSRGERRVGEYGEPFTARLRASRGSVWPVGVGASTAPEPAQRV